MPCRDYWYQTCGFIGECVNNTNVCFCELNEWTQNAEFAVLLEDENLVTTLPCDFHEGWILLIYSLLGIFNALVLLMYIYLYKVVVQKKQNNDRKRFLNRVIPLIFCLVLNIVWAAIRIFEPSSHFGNNISIPIVVSVSAWLFEYTGAYLNTSFLDYLLRNFPLLDRFLERRIVISKRLTWVHVVLISVSSGLVITFGFNPYGPVGAKILLAAFTVYILSGFLMIFMVWYSFGLLQRDIKNMIRGQHDLVELDTETKINLRRLIPKLKSHVKGITLINGFRILLFLPAFFKEEYVLVFKYILPLAFLMFTFTVYTIIQPQVKFVLNKSKKFASLVEVEDLLE